MKIFTTLRSQLQFYIRLRRCMSTLGPTKNNLSVEQGPYTAKLLSSPNELFDAQALMYQYIREMEWNVDEDHPSGTFLKYSSKMLACFEYFFGKYIINARANRSRLFQNLFFIADLKLFSKKYQQWNWYLVRMISAILKLY